MKKTMVEYAVQKHNRDGWHDITIYNKSNCHWTEPIGKWPKKIKTSAGWAWDWYQKKCGKRLRLVKRTTFEEICK